MDNISSAFLGFKRGLARIVRRIVRNPVDVEDILQEAYVRTLEAGKNQVIRTPKAFLARTARNLAINHIRLASEKLKSEAEEIDFSSVHGDEKEIADQVFIQSRFFLFCKAVESLSTQCRQVFILKKIYGMSQKEIASCLEISEKTVEFHVGKGLYKCRKYLQSVEDKKGQQLERSDKVKVKWL